MKELSILLMVGCMTSVHAFEIKPVCPIGGANCNKANTDKIEFIKDSKKCKHPFFYTIFGMNQPIHEAITRKAYKEVYGDFKGEKKTYIQSLLGGVEWNDDPEISTRKLWYNMGLWKTLHYPFKIFGNKDKITHRSHYKDMQFLHAMKPVSEKPLSNDETKQLIYDWIKNTYYIIRGDIKYDQDIQGTYFEKYFTKDLGYKKIYNIYNPKGGYVDQEDVILFASGSILHIIQDSYSQSHTERDPITGKINVFYQYGKDSSCNHCLSDDASIRNKESIEKATEMSVKYLELRQKHANWCAMAKFIKEDVFDMTNIKDDSCLM